MLILAIYWIGSVGYNSKRKNQFSIDLKLYVVFPAYTDQFFYIYSSIMFRIISF